MHVAGLTIGVALSLSSLMAGAQRVADIDTAAVSRFVEAYRARTGLPGAVVAITRGSRVVHVAGYGRTADGNELTPFMRVPIASLSKSVTSLAVMQLVDSGLIALDSSVRIYLPEFVVDDSRGSRITVRQLLNHTSGMADTEFREKGVGLPASLRDAVALLRQAKLASDPGTAMHYHNPNYWVAARLVEVMSGMSFADYLQQRVLGPAGMRASTTVRHLPDASDVARGHIRLYASSFALPEPAWYLDGSSGVVTTAADLARWLIAQGPETQLISRATIDAMHAGHLGWAAAPDAGGFALSGWLFTYTARMVLLPASGYGLAVVANRGISLGPDDSRELMNGLVELTRGVTPTVGLPLGTVVDLVLALLTVCTAVLGILRLRRAPEWANRWHTRPWMVVLAGCLPWILPIVLLATLRAALGAAFGGRDATWEQMLYVVPSLAGWLVVAAGVGVAVIVRRTVLVLLLRRSDDASPATRPHHAAFTNS